MKKSPDLVRVEDLHIRFQLQSGVIDVVKGVSFRIRPGSIVAIVGESGSGKSVMAQAIMGILPNNGGITSGRIVFNDPLTPETSLDLAALNRNSPIMQNIRGGRIAKIFQEPMTSLSPLHTIGNQIQEALVLHQDVEKSEYRKLTEEMLGLVGFNNPRRAYSMYPFELSGGLRQRAMIAMALICRPALLIADEPTTALDVTIQAQILKLLKSLQQKLDMAILLITHDLGVVANVADEVVVVYHGQVMEAGPVQHLFSNPRHRYLQALYSSVPHFDMHEGERLRSLREIKVDAVNLLGDREKHETAPRDSSLLTVEDLSKTYVTRSGGSLFSSGKRERIKAVDDVSFLIKKGECFGLVGESGCGKTTVSKLLMRAVSADAGKIIFSAEDGEINVRQLRNDALKAFRRRVQMVFQDPFSSLSPRMTVANILREPLEIHDIGDQSSRTATVRNLLKAVGLDERFMNRYPHSFSGGQRQRIGIARALALQPELLICDEPVSALDVSVQAQVLNLLKDIQQQLGLTYLFISHNLAVVDYMADRIAVMCRGRIVETAPRELLFNNPVHSYTRSLLSAVPYPDLSRQLDFSRQDFEGASDYQSWSPSFRPDLTDKMAYIELRPEHYVLCSENTELRELG